MLKKTLGLLASAAMALGVSQMASAADLPMKAVAAPLPVWTWTGFYVGAHVGAGWGTTESTLTRASFPGLGAVAFTFPFSQNSRSGFLGGGQVGYNWQSGLVVIGAQADIAGMDVKGTTPCLVLLACTSKSDWLATATGRIGAVVMDRGLIYAKGGAAWMNTTHSVSIFNTQLTSKESTSWGWTLGMGTEWMITRNWTAFVEYNYIEFDKKNEAFTFVALPGLVINADLKNKLSVAKVGVNYKF
jgi:outer membrane immunogenic protein